MVDGGSYAVTKAKGVVLPVIGRDEMFPVRRVYCVGRNYAEHAREMGQDPDASDPIFFMKPADNIVLADKTEHCSIPYPPQTENLHHEIELVVALGRGGENIAVESAQDHIFGYGVGVDLTRRDLQAQAKEKSHPWELAKGFDRSAPMSHLVEKTDTLDAGRIWLCVDGKLRQNGDIKDMIWSVSEVISKLSKYFKLYPGDLIFTGTPEGVGPLNIGEHVTGGVDGVATLDFTIISPEQSDKV